MACYCENIPTQPDFEPLQAYKVLNFVKIETILKKNYIRTVFHSGSSYNYFNQCGNYIFFLSTQKIDRK